MEILFNISWTNTSRATPVDSFLLWMYVCCCSVQIWSREKNVRALVEEEIWTLLVLIDRTFCRNMSRIQFACHLAFLNFNAVAIRKSWERLLSNIFLYSRFFYIWIYFWTSILIKVSFLEAIKDLWANTHQAGIWHRKNVFWIIGL